MNCPLLEDIVEWDKGECFMEGISYKNLKKKIIEDFENDMFENLTREKLLENIDAIRWNNEDCCIDCCYDKYFSFEKYQMDFDISVRWEQSFGLSGCVGGRLQKDLFSK